MWIDWVLDCVEDIIIEVLTSLFSKISILTKDLKEMSPKSFVSAALVATGNQVFPPFGLFTLLW